MENTDRISLKTAAREDIPLIRKLAAESWQAAYHRILSQQQIDYMLGIMYSEDELISHFAHPQYHYILICKEGTAAGFMGYELHHEERTAKLHRLYLIDRFKGLGLGKYAVQYLKKASEDAGDRRIILNVNKNNPARRFYESEGFRIYDEGVFDIGNGYVMDDYLMEYHF